jgi:hypothetical protein
VLIVATAAPAAFALELAARAAFLPREFELVRAELAPVLTPAAWACLLMSVPAGAAGIFLHRALVRRGLAKTPDQSVRVETGALLLASCIPQIPAFAATVGSLLGAANAPVLATLATSTVAILLQAYLPSPGPSGFPSASPGGAGPR